MKVPTYERQNVAFQSPNNYQNQTDIREYGLGGVDQAAQGFANALQGYGKEQHNEQTEQMVAQNKIIAQNVIANATNQANTFYYGDNGPATLKGINAIPSKDSSGKDIPGAVGQTEAGLTKIQQGIMNDASIPDHVKLAVAPIIDTHFNTLRTDAMKRQSEQMQIASQQAYAGNLAATSNSFQQATVAGNNDSADQAILDSMSQVRANGKQQGLPQNAIDANVMKNNYAMISSAVMSLANTNPQLARQYQERYADKLSPDDNTKLNTALAPKLAAYDSIQINNDLLSRYPNDELGAMKELNSTYANNPSLSKFQSNLRLAYSDQNKAKTEANKANYESTLEQLLKNQDSVSTMQGILDNSTLQASDRVRGQSFIDGKKRIADRLAKGNASQGETWAHSYGKSQLTNDTLKLQELENEYNADPGSFTDAKWNSYSLIKARLNNYLSIVGGGSQSSQHAQQETPQDPNAVWYDQTYRAIKAKFPDATDEEVKAYMTEGIQKAGG